MRAVLFSYGTRGDAQSQVVLASMPRERGDQVRLAAPENLHGFVKAAGLEYAPLFGNSQEIFESETGRKWLSAGNVRAFMKSLSEIKPGSTPSSSSLIGSVFADQPFWGARVTWLGVGAHVPFARLNQKTLAARLKVVLTDKVRQPAAAHGEKLRAEHRTAATVEALLKHIGPPRKLDAVDRTPSVNLRNR